MNIIAKISYFERSVVTLKLRKEYLNTVTYNIYGSFKLSKKQSGFFGPLCIGSGIRVKLSG